MKRLWFILLLASICQGYVADKPILGIPLNGDHDLSRGLVGIWLFNDRLGVVGRAYDLSGNGNNGTLVGDTSSVPGKFGPALDFDGTDDWVTIPDTPVLRFDSATQDFSTFAWIRFTADPTSSTQTIADKRDANNDGWFWVSLSGTMRMSINATDVSTNTQITDTEWHFIGAVIRRPGEIQMYLDGVADGSGAVSGAMATTVDLRFGATNTGTLDYTGEMDQVLIYNRVLSANEITSLHADSFQMFEQERLPIASAAAPAEVGQFIMIMSSGSLLVVLIAFSFWKSGRKAA